MYDLLKIEHKYETIDNIYMQHFISHSLMRNDLILQDASNKCFASLIKPHLLNYKLHHDKFIPHLNYNEDNKTLNAYKKLIVAHIQLCIDSSSSNLKANWNSYISLMKQLAVQCSEIFNEAQLAQIMIKANFSLVV